MEEHTSHEKEHEHKIHKVDFTSQLRKNPWILSTLVLGIVVLILLVGSFGSNMGKVISEENAKTTFLNTIEKSGANLEEIEITNISKESNMYEINIKYQGQDYPVPFFLTLDGEYLGNMQKIAQEETTDTTTTSTQTQTTDVPKTDKPNVELFIWGYCPYGIAAQGPLAEVASLLKNEADFKAVLYYAGHGEYEAQQNKIQECIQEIALDKYWDYASGFVEDIYPKCGSSRDIACDKDESVKLMKSLGINSDAVMSCVDTKGDSLQATASSRASSLGVTGSPTLVINGVKVSTARTAEAFKTAICDAFNVAPAECSETLDSTATTASGNC